MTTWIVTFAIGLGVMLLMVMAINWLLRAVRTKKEEFYCPWAHRRVAVRYLTLDGRRPVGVISCSAFSDTAGVVCGMPCLAGGVRDGLTKDHQDHVLDLLNG